MFVYIYTITPENFVVVSVFWRELLTFYFVHFRARLTPRHAGFKQENTPNTVSHQQAVGQLLIMPIKLQSTCMLKFQKTQSNHLFS